MLVVWINGKRDGIKIIILIRNVKMCSYFNLFRIIDEVIIFVLILEFLGFRDIGIFCIYNWLGIRVDDLVGRLEGDKGIMLVGFLI